MMSDSGGGAQLWVLAGLSLLNSLFFPILVTACCIYGILRFRKYKENTPNFFGRTFSQLCIETLRTWGSALRWGFLFIIPGAIRLLQLIFVPFVVCLSRDYENGSRDALKTSSQYFRRRIISTTALVIVFELVIPLILTEILDPWRSFEKTPVSALFCTAADLLVAVFFTQALYRIFESVRQELKDESVLQLERR